MNVLAVIPARGGSKRIPGKNIVPLAGKPLIAWMIQAAQGARLLDRIVVDTDSEKIAAVARSFGAETPYIRPEFLARDETTTIDTLKYTLQWFAEHENYVPDYLMCLQTTFPFMTSADIDNAIQLAQDRQADGVVSVAPMERSPLWMKTLDESGRMVDLIPADSPLARQVRGQQVYELNGALYMARPELLLEQNTWYTDQTYAYVMQNDLWVDIDTPADLRLADLILQERVKGNEEQGVW